MTRDTAVPVTDVEIIERKDASRPWGLNGQTVQQTGRVEGLHRRVDTAFVPQAAQEPIDHVEVLFTVDERVLGRRDRDVEDLISEVASIIESDRRLEEYVVWEHIEPSAEVARLDPSRSRVRITWRVGGDEE